jgi:hypothetical protein
VYVVIDIIRLIHIIRIWTMAIGIEVEKIVEIGIEIGIGIKVETEIKTWIGTWIGTEVVWTEIVIEIDI